MRPFAALLSPLPRDLRPTGSGSFLPISEPILTLCAPEPQPATHRLLREAVPHLTVLCRKTPEYALIVGDAPVFTGEPLPNHPEGYRLTVATEGLHAAALTARGLFRAAATVSQILTAQDPVPSFVADDTPAHPMRGLMLDVSRNRTYSLQTLFGIVDRMARLKLNRLELYFENVFAHRDHAEVWSNTTPYTREDIRALEAYCADRFIDLVPNQNTLGHFERWFAHPTYLRYAELPEGGARTPWGSIQAIPTGIATADPDAVRFVGGLLHELLPCFSRATVANLGGDEVFDLGQGRSRGRDRATLFVNHLRAMADIAAQYGKRPCFWADMLIRHPEIIPLAAERLPEAEWLVWGYEATDPLAASAEKLRAAGLHVSVAPGTSSWRSFCGRTANMTANIRVAAAVPSEGLLLTDWGDAGHWQPHAVSLPALVLAASLAWNPEEEPDIALATDRLTGCNGLGTFLLTLGDTAQLANAEGSNATRLFQAYNLPPEKAPALDREALLRALDALDTLERDGRALGDRIEAREARYALALQQLAMRRALGETGLRRFRARVAAQMELLWHERGPTAGLADSLRSFLAPRLP